MLSPVRHQLIQIVLSTVVAFVLAATEAPSIQAADDPQSTVSLAIDFGDGSELHFTQLAWHDNMTVLDALATAAKHARGVKYKVRSSGSFAFVTEIDGLANEGGNGRNWLFQVNDKLGKVGAGVQELEVGDSVQWNFAKYNEP